MEILNLKDTLVPVHSWVPVEELYGGAMEQIKNVASHPEVGPFLAVMADVHVGYGVTIGSVVPTTNSVIPNAVGVDIGCGISAYNTGIQYDRQRMDRDFWRNFKGKVDRNIPTGTHSHQKEQDLGSLDTKLQASSLQELVGSKGSLQLGTLGGGNHFLEAAYDNATSNIWLLVHSGSRHIGLRIAGYYHQLAIEESKSRGLSVGRDLSSLWNGGVYFSSYLEDHNWARRYAAESRKRMLTGLTQCLTGDYPDFTNNTWIDLSHNYVEEDTFEDEPIMVHRKGATSARLGQLGIIPSSMGTNTFIVKGLGNPNSLMSCSHGSGRVMGRGEAKRTFTTDQFQQDISHTFSTPSEKYIDESPAAYKDPQVVISRQMDLVEIVHTLTPIITMKGGGKDD